MNDPLIDQLITSRNAITNRRDEKIDFNAVDYIDSILATVTPGARNDVDLLLGRTCATLPQRADYGQAANETTGQYIARIWDSIPEEAY